jgi:hypothetical protein
VEKIGSQVIAGACRASLSEPSLLVENSQRIFSKIDYFNHMKDFHGWTQLGSMPHEFTPEGLEIYGFNFNFERLFPVSEFKSTCISLGASLQTSIPNTYRLQVYDGYTSSQSPYHSGNGKFEFLKLTHTIHPMATKVWVRAIQADRNKGKYEQGFVKIANVGISASKVQVQIDEFNKKFQVENPDLTPELVQAWTKCTSSPQTLASLVNRYDAQKTFTQEGRALNLFWHPSPGDGDCGYWSMGLLRSQAYDMIRQNLHNERYRKMIVPGMLHALIQQEFPKKIIPVELQDLLRDYFELDEISQNIIGSLKDFIGENNIDLNALINHEAQDVELQAGYFQVEHRREELKRQMRQRLADPDLIAKYLEAEILGGEQLDFVRDMEGDEHFNTSIIDVLAEIQGVNLVIYAPSSADGEDPYAVKPIHSHITPGAMQTKALLHTGNHYDCLLPQPKLVVVPKIGGDSILDKIEMQEIEIPENDQLEGGKALEHLDNCLTSPAQTDLEDRLKTFTSHKAEVIEGYENEIMHGPQNWQFYTHPRYDYVLGRYVTPKHPALYPTAEKLYNDALRKLQDDVKRLSDEKEGKKSSALLASVLRVAVVKGKLLYSSINGVLELMGYNPMPFILWQRDLPKECISKARAYIREKFSNGTNASEYIEITSSGIYVKKKDAPSQMVFSFEKGEVIEEGAYDYQVLMKRFIENSPQPGSEVIMDEMLQEVEKYLTEAGALKAVKPILSFAKCLLVNYRQVIDNAAAEGYSMIIDNPRAVMAAFHRERCDPIKIMLYKQDVENRAKEIAAAAAEGRKPLLLLPCAMSDGYTVQEALNKILNVFIEVYKIMKSKNRLEHYFKNAFDLTPSFVCLDAQSESIMTYFSRQSAMGFTDSNFSNLLKDQARDQILQRLMARYPRGIQEADLRAALLTYESFQAQTSQGPITKVDVGHWVDYAKQMGMVLDEQAGPADEAAEMKRMLEESKRRQAEFIERARKQAAAALQ